MGGRGSGGGRNSGGGGANKTKGEGITDKNELINLYNSISGNPSYTVEERVRAMSSIQEKIKEIDNANSKTLLTNETMNKYSLDPSGFVSDINGKLKNMSDYEIDVLYKSSNKNYKKAVAEYKSEGAKLTKLREEYNKIPETDAKKRVQKSKELRQQANKVEIARQTAGMYDQTHYLVKREKMVTRKNKKERSK